MTAVTWLLEELKKVHHPTEAMIIYAKKLEKQQIIDIVEKSRETGLTAEYLLLTYGSKGSDNSPKVQNKDSFGEISSQTEISDESWEGCDGCTEQDEVMYKNGYVKGYNSAISELPKEISDEEIDKASENAWSDYEYDEGNLYSTTFKSGWKLAIKWYKEQLKQL